VSLNLVFTKPGLAHPDPLLFTLTTGVGTLQGRGCLGKPSTTKATVQTLRMSGWIDDN
jgi:hypothetical protein